MPLAPPPDLPSQEIVVTGRGLDRAAADAAYDVSTVDRARLTGLASGRLEDALRDVAGFAQFRRSDSRSAHPTSQGATLRGLGGNASSRALVLLDGVPQVDPFGGWVSFSAFDPARLGEVRVTRGGGSGVFGAGALAGTIELVSADPADLAPLSGALSYGSRSSLDGDAMLAGRAGAGFVTASASYQRGDGFVPIVAAQRGPVDRRAHYAQASGELRGVAPLDAATELQADLRLIRDVRTRGLAGTANRNTGADASVRLVRRGRWGAEALAYVQLRKFSSGFASANAARTIVTATLDQYDVPATGIGGRIELRPPLGAGVELRLGGDVRRTDGETNELFNYVAGLPTRMRAAGGTSLTLGAFADASYALGAVTLTGGGRIDRWSLANGHLDERLIATGVPVAASAFPDRRGSRPTARGGLSYRAGRGISLRGAAYLGWRLPTLNELYRPFRAGADATAANAALAPEHLTGVDAGIDWRPLPSIHLGATVFRNVLHDAIGNLTLGQGPGTFAGVGFVAAGGVYRMRGNLDAIRSRGVEVEGNVTDGLWSLAFSYALADARVRASGASLALDGLRPAQTARHQASTTIARVDGDRRSISATLRYVSPQYEDDQNSRLLKGATTLDLVFATPIRGRLGVELRAENVTATRVEAAIAGDGTIERASPRTVWIGLRYGR